MYKMPIINTDKEIRSVIEQVVLRFKNYFDPVFIEDPEEAIEYLKYELPEISIINLSDPGLDSDVVLGNIKSDPWLHYGALVGIHLRRDEERLEAMTKESNLISLIPRGEVVHGLFRVLKIVVQNRQVLFQRDLQKDLLKTISGSYVLDNDPFNIKTYSSIIPNYLYNINYLNGEKRDCLHVALSEMMMNAVEHGSCNIGYDEKSLWLDEGNDILDLIRRKLRDPEIRKKRIFFSYRITPPKSYFSIKDEGGGFDWKSYLADGREPSFGLHGHGITMTKNYIQNMRYNDSGNEVFFEIEHQEDESNSIPGLFFNRDEVVFEDGETVFNEGEESNYLYYIASGKLGIYSNNKRISTLTPTDMFLGEMSFLLNDRRSARVVSHGKSVLLKISKHEFVNVIKDKPHYGILLARLLAQRLIRTNEQVAAM